MHTLASMTWTGVRDLAGGRATAIEEAVLERIEGAPPAPVAGPS